MKKYIFNSFFILLTLSVFGQFNPDSLIEYRIKPSNTEPLINDTVWNDSNYIYINHTATSLNKLFLFLPGSYAIPRYYKAITKKAANMGYHSIGLCYPNSWSMLGKCGYCADTNCHYNLRREVFYGINYSDSVDVDSVNCIKNRIIRLLEYLDIIYPNDNWGQYLDNNNEPVWNKIVFGGHSQGGGYGPLVALTNNVARLLLFASNDWSFYYNRPANWYSFPKVTLPNNYYSFTHLQDGFHELNISMNKLGIDTSLCINVDTSSFPYLQSHILTTNDTSAIDTTWFAYHNSIILDYYVPVDSLGNYVFNKVWEYLLSMDTTTNILEISPTKVFICNIYPNPTTGIFTVEGEDIQSIEIINIKGQMVKIFIIDNYQSSIDLSNQPKGIYVIKIVTDKRIAVKKVVLE